MRYLILSDLHANIEAFDAVMNAVEDEKIDKYVVCGDIVDYGPNPNEIIERLMKLPQLIAIKGDHERGVLDELEEEWFSNEALKAIYWTRANLNKVTRKFISDLPKGPLVVDGLFTIMHGSIFDEDVYLVYETEARDNLKAMQTNIGFFGHTHIPCYWSLKQGDLKAGGEIMRQVDLSLILDPEVKYLANAGSVGQPRDGNPLASYAIYDSDAHKVIYRRVAYDFDTTSKKIMEIGLDSFTADRLKSGL